MGRIRADKYEGQGDEIMGMTIKEGMQRIKREFAFGGVQAALKELDDIRWHGFMKAESRWSLEAQAYKFIGNQIAKLSSHTIFTAPIEGRVFTNNLSYAIEQGLRSHAINYEWGSFTLIVEGKEIAYINCEVCSESLTEGWYLYPQDLLEA